MDPNGQRRSITSDELLPISEAADRLDMEVRKFREIFVNNSRFRHFRHGNSILVHGAEIIRFVTGDDRWGPDDDNESPSE